MQIQVWVVGRPTTTAVIMVIIGTALDSRQAMVLSQVNKGFTVVPLGSKTTMTIAMASRPAMIQIVPSKGAMKMSQTLLSKVGTRMSQNSRLVMRTYLVTREDIKMPLSSKTVTAVAQVPWPTLMPQVMAAMNMGTTRTARTQAHQAILQGRVCRHKEGDSARASMLGLAKVSVVIQMAHSPMRVLQLKRKLDRIQLVETLIWYTSLACISGVVRQYAHC